MGDETEVVDVEKDSEEGQDVRVRESQVGMVTLDGVDEVGDVDAPKERRKTAAFRQAFEDLDVGGVVCETVENAVHEGVMECTDTLPEVRWDMGRHCRCVHVGGRCMTGGCKRCRGFDGVDDTRPERV